MSRRKSPPREQAKELKPVPELSLRPYSSQDRAACQRIAGSSDDYAHAIDTNADAIEVAEFDGEVVGFAFIQIWSWNRVAWLGEIVVHPEHRHEGIGTRLLERMEQRARERGCRVMMDHPPARHPSVPFYIARGYRICGYNDSFYDEADSTALFVCKDLA